MLRIIISLLLTFSSVIIACTDLSGNSKQTSEEQLLTQDSVVYATTILSKVVSALEDSLDRYADFIDKGIGEPSVMQNFQNPISISLHVENDTLFLIYSCSKWHEMVTDKRNEKYIIPIKSSKSYVTTSFTYSKEQKQIVFYYDGFVYINNEPQFSKNVKTRITTKLSPGNFESVIHHLNLIGLTSL